MNRLRYGHWGRAVLFFPTEQGKAADFEHNGLCAALSGLLETGRMKAYCVDSYDHESWSNQSVPLEERARRHGQYERWILDEIVPWIYEDCGGPLDIIALGCSLGAFHAANFALKHADLFPRALCFSGNYDPSSWHAWGERGNETYFNNPMDYVSNLHGEHLDWLRGRLHLLLVCGQGQWEDTTGALDSTRRFAALLNDKGISHELDLWGHDVPHDWPSWRAQIAYHLPRFVLAGAWVMTEHLIGLLLGTEEDWPTAFEEILRRLGPVDGHKFATERITIEPFNLRDRPRYDLVIDRLAYWYYHPREWLKKVALMDGVYLLNSPFTFQSMEKHAAYCAMIRLGLKVPETVLVPYKNPVDNARYAYTAARYNQPFDLDAIARGIGYPLFMKPYDGGAWRGVSRIRDERDLHAAYDASGEMLMHLQKAVDYDVFARSLSIGAETMVMKFQPDQPMHSRYAVAHSFLSDQVGAEVVTIGKLVNAFFRWEFNSCETLVQGGEVYPIDYANACPDVALNSLHYYFPWAMKALVKWCVFAMVTGRRPKLDLDTDAFFAMADVPGMTYPEKLAAYRGLADEYFSAPAYAEFCAGPLRYIDEVVFDWVSSDAFDALLVRTVRSVYPAAEQDWFIAHLRGLIDLWKRDEEGRHGA